MGCKNKVSQFIPNNYGHNEVKLDCGSISIHGGTLICEDCEVKFMKQYPQGWKHVPGDICKHGTYIGDTYGADYICGYCEDGI